LFKESLGSQGKEGQKKSLYSESRTAGGFARRYGLSSKSLWQPTGRKGIVKNHKGFGGKKEAKKMLKGDLAKLVKNRRPAARSSQIFKKGKHKEEKGKKGKDREQHSYF